MKNTPFSRHRPRSKGDIGPKLVRTEMDQVSGELVRTILSPDQLAFEHARREFDRKAVWMSEQDRRRFHEKCVLHLLRFLVRDPEWNQDEVGRLREVCAGLLERLGGEVVFEGDGAGV